MLLRSPGQAGNVEEEGFQSTETAGLWYLSWRDRSLELPVETSGLDRSRAGSAALRKEFVEGISDFAIHLGSEVPSHHLWRR